MTISLVRLQVTVIIRTTDYKIRQFLKLTFNIGNRTNFTEREYTKVCSLFVCKLLILKKY